MKIIFNPEILILSMVVLPMIILPASALSGDLEYLVVGSDIKIDTSYTMGDITYTNSFAGVGDGLGIIQGKSGIGPESFAELNSKMQFDGPDQSWTNIQTMANSDEQATLKTSVSGADALMSYAGTASLSDSKFSSSIDAVTPIDLSAEDGSGVVGVSNNGYISIDQIGYGWAPNKPPTQVEESIVVRPHAQINMMRSFQLTPSLSPILSTPIVLTTKGV